jgi:NTF2 fold immunity protein of polymorphic toxin system component
MKISAAICGAFLIASLAFGQGEKPKAVAVPDSAAAAIQRGEKAMIKAFGRKEVESKKPLAAKLDGEVWTVYVTQPCAPLHATYCLGGGLQAKISKKDGRVLSVQGFK